VQVLESFVSIKSNALSDSICQSALSLAATALPAAVATACSGTAPDAAGKKARADMAYVALCGGMVLANSGLGAVHGIAAPLGGTFGVPHGAACAALLAPACEANIRALRERESNSPALSRYRQLAIMLSGDASAKAEYLPVFLESLVANIGIKALSAFGVDQASIPGLVTAAQASNSMKGNPIKLTDAETAWIIGRAAAGFR
jgi:alcohol dehydrogenase class IV